MIPRRGLLAGLGALLAAPAIIRTPGLLMPVKPVLLGVDFGRDEGTVVGVPWSEWNTWIERMYARRIGPFQGPAGPFYAVLRGEGA